jgi:hypothetical protein
MECKFVGTVIELNVDSLFHDLSITDALGEPDEWPALNLRPAPKKRPEHRGTIPRPSFNRMLWGHWHPVESQSTPAAYVPSRLLPRRKRPSKTASGANLRPLETSRRALGKM